MRTSNTGLVECRPLQACCRRHGWGPKALGMCTCSGRISPTTRGIVSTLSADALCNVQMKQCIWRRSRRTCRSVTSWWPQISSSVAPTVNKASVAAVHQRWQQALPHNRSRKCWHVTCHTQHIVGGRYNIIWVTCCLYASELCHTQQVAAYTMCACACWCMRSMAPPHVLLVAGHIGIQNL